MQEKPLLRLLRDGGVQAEWRLSSCPLGVSAMAPVPFSPVFSVLSSRLDFNCRAVSVTAFAEYDFHEEKHRTCAAFIPGFSQSVQRLIAFLESQLIFV